MKTLILFLTFIAGSDGELIKAAGGSLEELRAVLYLDSTRTGRVKAAFDAARTSYKTVEETERSRGTDAADQERMRWAESFRAEIRNCLEPPQIKRYEAWLKRKADWASEYDKLVYGIPPVTQIRATSRWLKI